jgi:protein-L-isoaspartate(D-aspartate) O-methyltransferase
VARVARLAAIFLSLFWGGCVCLAQSASFDGLRAEMVRAIDAKAREDHFPRNRFWKSALASIAKTPRHLFVPEAARAEAYSIKPVLIGYDQTISSPYIVAIMTALARVGPDANVLEIGTGSGYQAAILSPLVARVSTIEIVAPLAAESAQRLTSLHYANVAVRTGDGYQGWADHGPYDAIIVTAGAKRVPPALVAQLKTGGRMIIPLGPNWAQQNMIRFTKRQDGTLRREDFGNVFFVPFTGEIERNAPREVPKRAN